MVSAQSTFSASTGSSASALIPAEPASTPHTPSNTRSAVGLRRRLRPQMNSTRIRLPRRAFYERFRMIRRFELFGLTAADGRDAGDLGGGGDRRGFVGVSVVDRKETVAQKRGESRATSGEF